jgi:hypothetical protein
MMKGKINNATANGGRNSTAARASRRLIDSDVAGAERVGRLTRLP